MFATVVGHRCLHTVSCDPLFHFKYSKMNTIFLTKHYAALIAVKSTIVRSLWIWNVRINIKIYNKISSRYTFQPLYRLVLNWRCIWPAGDLYAVYTDHGHLDTSYYLELHDTDTGPAISRTSSTLAYSDCAPNSRDLVRRS